MPGSPAATSGNLADSVSHRADSTRERRNAMGRILFYVPPAILLRFPGEPETFLRSDRSS
jgi:hypothetical protein